MIAPTVAENLYNHLEKGEELDKEINIKGSLNNEPFILLYFKK